MVKVTQPRVGLKQPHIQQSAGKLLPKQGSHHGLHSATRPTQLRSRKRTGREGRPGGTHRGSAQPPGPGGDCRHGVRSPTPCEHPALPPAVWHNTGRTGPGTAGRGSSPHRGHSHPQPGPNKAVPALPPAAPRYAHRPGTSSMLEMPRSHMSTSGWFFSRLSSTIFFSDLDMAWAGHVQTHRQKGGSRSARRHRPRAPPAPRARALPRPTAARPHPDSRRGAAASG